MLQQVDRVQSLQSMTTSMLDEFFAEEEEADRERDSADDVTTDDAVTSVLVELGCLLDITAAPAIVGGHVPSNNNGGNALDDVVP